MATLEGRVAELEKKNHVDRTNIDKLFDRVYAELFYRVYAAEKLIAKMGIDHHALHANKDRIARLEIKVEALKQGFERLAGLPPRTIAPDRGDSDRSAWVRSFPSKDREVL